VDSTLPALYLIVTPTTSLKSEDVTEKYWMKSLWMKHGHKMTIDTSDLNIKLLMIYLQSAMMKTDAGICASLSVSLLRT